MEREVFAPWELQYAAELNAAQPVKNDSEPKKREQHPERTPLKTRQNWWKQGRKVTAQNSEARFVSRYADSGKSRWLFSEDQTEPLLHTRSQWENQHGRRVTARNSEAKSSVPLSCGRTVHLYDWNQTELMPIDLNAADGPRISE